MTFKKIPGFILFFLILPVVSYAQGPNLCGSLPENHPCSGIVDPDACDLCLEGTGGIPIDSHIIVLFVLGIFLGTYAYYIRRKSANANAQNS